ncbi:MAG: PadR family transcriptional regulator [Limnochordia bacterium]|jgi:PadR family transcriptional regulator PadR
MQPCTHGPGCCRKLDRGEPFLHPCLLLLLLREPGHGYELLDRLAKYRLPAVDTGGFYRHLRRLEKAGFLTSTWDTEGKGPARRMYTVTPAGIAHLAKWVDTARQQARSLQEFAADAEAALASLENTEQHDHDSNKGEPHT